MRITGSEKVVRTSHYYNWKRQYYHHQYRYLSAGAIIWHYALVSTVMFHTSLVTGSVFCSVLICFFNIGYT